MNVLGVMVMMTLFSDVVFSCLGSLGLGEFSMFPFAVICKRFIMILSKDQKRKNDQWDTPTAAVPQLIWTTSASGFGLYLAFRVQWLKPTETGLADTGLAGSSWLYCRQALARAVWVVMGCMEYMLGFGVWAELRVLVLLGKCSIWGGGRCGWDANLSEVSVQGCLSEVYYVVFQSCWSLYCMLYCTPTLSFTSMRFGALRYFSLGWIFPTALLVLWYWAAGFRVLYIVLVIFSFSYSVSYSYSYSVYIYIYIFYCTGY